MYKGTVQTAMVNRQRTRIAGEANTGQRRRQRGTCVR